MSAKIKIIILILILAAAGATAFWLWPDKTAPESGGADKAEYKSELFGFSFQYPEGFKVSEFEEENGKVILFEASGKTSDVESPKTSDVEELAGFQIFITPFDESGPLTAERIKKDLPNAVVENPTLVKVGPSTGSGQAEALSFVGEGDPPTGLSADKAGEAGGFKTAEGWFVWPPEPYPNGNYLYQITAKVEDAKLLEGIITTWKFQQN